jgi:energy-coupling factor transport system ATP-binding protein
VPLVEGDGTTYQYCDRVVIMAGGTIILDAPVREAFQNEAALSASSLHPPQVTMLGRALGYQGVWLTVEEAFAALKHTRIGANHGA